jgi:sugar phosphate isomerase/epimerase
MSHSDSFVSRRAVLASAVVPLFGAGKRPPVGLELFSVREELAKDLFGTVRAVAKMGYDGVEFYAPYIKWTPAYAKDVRKLLDDLGIRCFSTHTGSDEFAPERFSHAIELNTILGSKFIVMASAGRVSGLDGWKTVAKKLNFAAEKARPAGLRVGYHNHHVEFKAIDGVRPIEVIARETGKDVALQLDVGTSIEAGSDPVAWINQNPGRIASIHCKDWSSKPGLGYRVLTGEGDAPWKQIIAACEKTGGLEYYLVEQEGSDYSEFETAERCLKTFRGLMA